MRQVLCVISIGCLAMTAGGVEPITFNMHSISTNDPIDSAAAEALFLSTVEAGGYSGFSEDFEASVWNPTRSPLSASTVLSHGITWQSSAGNRIKTYPDSDSYDDPPLFMVWGHNPVSGLHPVPNTVIGESTTRLYGIGFWADGTGTKGKIKVILDDTVEVKFKRITGYEHNPPDPPEPIKETVRLGYAKAFFGVCAPDGFHTFQLLEFAGEFDEVVLMWMRTFSFAYLPPARTGEIAISSINPDAGQLDIDFTLAPVYSHPTLQASADLTDPVGWYDFTNAPVLMGQNLYRITVPLPTDTNSAFRIINRP